MAELDIDVDFTGNEAALRTMQRMDAALSSLEKGVNRLSGVINRNSTATRANTSAFTAGITSLQRWGHENRRAADSSRNLTLEIGGLKAALAGLGAGVALGEVRALADEWTTAENKLAIAGFTGAKLNGQMAELADIAVRARTEFGSIATMYGRMVMASEELKISMTDVGRITETTAKALAGVTAGERASAVTQLVQGLGSGNLAGDELKAIRENSQVLSQAIADEFGVKIGELKKLGEEGKLSSARVAQAILKAEGDINAAFSRTNATMEDSITNFKTRFAEYVGGIDDATGASQKFFEALTYAGEHLDDIGDAALFAATILGGALAGQAMAAVVRGTIAMNLAFAISGQRMTAMAVSAGVARTAMTGLRASMAFLGGPVGVAITAASVGVALLAKRNMDAAQAAQELRDRVAEKKRALDQAKQSADQARIETGNLTKAEMDAATKAAALTGEQDKLTNAFYRTAAAAKAARLEILRTQLTEAQNDERVAREAYGQRRRISAAPDRMTSTPYGSSMQIGGSPFTAAGDARARASQEGATYRDAYAVREAAQAELTKAEREKVASFAPQTVASVGGGGKKDGSGRGGGKSDAERAAEQYANSLENLRNEQYLLTLSERDRAASQAQVSAGLKADIALTDEKAVAVRDLAYKVYDAQKLEENTQEAKQRGIELEKELLSLQREVLSVTDPAAARVAVINDEYAAQERYIKALKLRIEEEEKLLKLERERRDAALAVEAAYSKKAVADNNRDLDRQEQDLAIRQRGLVDPRAADREKQFVDLERQREDAVANIDSNISRESEAYKALVERINKLHDAQRLFLAESFAVEDYMELYEGLTDAFTDLFDDPKRALQEYTTMFIQNMARMIVQAMLLKRVMGENGQGGGGLNFGDIAKNALLKTFGGGRAIGGSTDPNKLTLVGEHGPELVRAAGHVIPAGATRTALAAAGNSSKASVYSPTFHNQISFNGNAEEAKNFSKQMTAEQMTQWKDFVDSRIAFDKKFN